MTSNAFDSRLPDPVTVAEPLVSPKWENDNEPSGGATDSDQPDDAEWSGTTHRTGLISWRSVRTLWRALTVCDDSKLTADESASSLFRFFRSKHVVDLKLIFVLTLFVFAAHLVIALALSDLSIFSWIKWMAGFAPPPIPPATADAAKATASVSTYIGPAVPVYSAILAWAYLNAAKRLGVVDLFACEIGTVCRVGTIFDIGKRYVEKYSGSTADNAGQAAKMDGAEEQSSRFVSQEGYFPIFDNNSNDLQALEALVVKNITEFYTYMKAMRDLQRMLAGLDPTHISLPEISPDGSIKEDLWHETLANLIYVLFLGYESARNSVDDLIEFQPTRAEDTIVILLTELACYSFLTEYFYKKKDAVRFNRLQLRKDVYAALVPKLVRKVKARHDGNEQYWEPATRTLSELEARYELALGSVRGCVPSAEFPLSFGNSTAR